MPPLDPTIPLRAISGRRNNLVDEYAAAVNIKNAFAQQKALEADLARQESVRNAFAGAVDPATGEMDWHRASNALAPIDPQAAMGLRKDLAEERAAETSHRLDQLQLHAKAFERAAQMLQSAQTQADWDAGIMWGEQFLGPELMRGVPRVFSEQARQMVLQSVLSVKDQLDMARDQRRFEADDAYRNAQLGETRRHNLASEANAGRISPPSGYRWTAGGGLEAIPGGPATMPKDPPAGYRWAQDGALEPIAGGPADRRNPANVTEGERKAATLAVRLQGALSTIDEVERLNPKAAKPEIDAAFAGSMPFIGDAARETARNLFTSEPRQRVEAAQLDALDAALTLATGAAYTREQLMALRKSYFPQIGDTEQTVKDKRQRFNDIVAAARLAAGRAEPQIDQALGRTTKRPEDMTDQELLQAIYARGQ